MGLVIRRVKIAGITTSVQVTEDEARLIDERAAAASSPPAPPDEGVDEVAGEEPATSSPDPAPKKPRASGRKRKS